MKNVDQVAINPRAAKPFLWKGAMWIPVPVDEYQRLNEDCAELKSKLNRIAKLCDETDIETGEATQAWLVDNIRAVLS